MRKSHSTNLSKFTHCVNQQEQLYSTSCFELQDFTRSSGRVVIRDTARQTLSPFPWHSMPLSPLRSDSQNTQAPSTSSQVQLAGVSAAAGRGACSSSAQQRAAWARVCSILGRAGDWAHTLHQNKISTHRSGYSSPPILSIQISM